MAEKIKLVLGNDKVFCDEYIRTHNQVKSAMLAYNINNYKLASKKAARIIRKQLIKDYISEIMEAARTKQIASITDRQVMLTDIMYGRRKEPVYVNRFGDTIEQEKLPSNKDVITAIDVLNKMDGAYEQSDKSSGNGNITIINNIPTVALGCGHKLARDVIESVEFSIQQQLEAEEPKNQLPSGDE